MMFRLLPLLAAVALPLGAAAETLPLRHGTYVMAGTPCADAPFAAMRSWDGVGLGDPHSHACRARLLSHRGDRFSIANSCIGVGVGPGQRSTERLVLAITTRTNFAIDGTRYRLCPAIPLPPR